MAKVKAVLFDLDGTLLDSILVYEIVFNKILRHFGLPTAKKEMVRQFMRRGKNPWKDKMPGICLTPEMIIEGKRMAREAFLSAYQNVHVIRGVLALLSELEKRSIKKAIVTSSLFRGRIPGSTIRLMGMMDTVISKLDTERHKPYPDPIFKACENLGVAPENAIYVGDSPLDIKAAKAAGVLAVGVLWGVSTRERLQTEDPDEIAISFDHLNKIIFSRI